MKHVMGAICLATAAAIWGASQVVSKFVMHETPPMTLTFVRFVLAALVLTIALGTKIKRTYASPILCSNRVARFSWLYPFHWQPTAGHSFVFRPYVRYCQCYLINILTRHC